MSRRKQARQRAALRAAINEGREALTAVSTIDLGPDFATLVADTLASIDDLQRQLDELEAHDDV